MIRRATIADMPELMRMAFEFHKAANLRRLALFEVSTDSWRDWLGKCVENPCAVCLVAEDAPAEGTSFAPVVCGFLAGVVFPAYWNPKILAAHECNIWVDKDHRGKGLGGELLEAFTKWGESVGAVLVASGSTVHMGPKEMGRLLMAHGFQLEERTYSKRVQSCRG
jgi:GNAT superfamily N-acetyltransferase